MRIVVTFLPSEKLQKELQEEFKNCEFTFVKNIENGHESILKEAEVIVTYGEDITDEMVENMPSVKWFMVASAGLEKMPLKWIEEKTILLTNAKGIHKKPMAEFAIGTILRHAKRFQELDRQQQAQTWNRRLPFKELTDDTLLIVGTGAIGQEIAKFAKAFDIQTVGINTSGKRVPYFDETFSMGMLGEILSKADYVINLLPSTPSTRYVYDLEHFNKMKSSAVFINLGRGDAVSQDVLVEGARKIAHLYLDVFEIEPLPKVSPLWTSPNVTITPHISSISSYYQIRAMEIFKENLQAYLNGKEHFLNQVPPSRGY
ncbi:3-phosphoglycerate dehydrogenase [Bacillus coahuilensis m2-6]|uniref:D-2-hydroxyacid dehydrogenase n=1 Tax=Bacillus coahuilensis TaxID=408580 RepID=UPI0007503220|nr:D-2-hydroxyacid dehydrogenase [Bacillus coahuilensis]KUP09637.1 3-phosphoglycerate dehydrogenase [Bacillus coahuilensis m2-6]